MMVYCREVVVVVSATWLFVGGDAVVMVVAVSR
jgi:hypothetical protein